MAEFVFGFTDSTETGILFDSEMSCGEMYHTSADVPLLRLDVDFFMSFLINLFKNSKDSLDLHQFKQTSLHLQYKIH